jgi:hypothetical protein
MTDIKTQQTEGDVYLAQALNYLKAYRLAVDLLINFGARSLEFQRLILTHKSAQSINPKICDSDI